jgi:hypothetical protein
MISLAEAKAYVECDLALFCSFAGSGPICLSQMPEGYYAIVKMGKGGKLRARTITDNDLDRAYILEHEPTRVFVEQYGQTISEFQHSIGAELRERKPWGW